MKRSPLLSLALVSWICSAQGQPTFEKLYHGVGSTQMSLIELSSRNLVAGIAYQSGTSVMDPLGNILHTQCYAIDTFVLLQAVKKYADNEFCFVGAYYKDTCSSPGWGVLTNFYPVIGRMDSLGNVIASRHYVLNAGCQKIAGDLEITSNKSVITWGSESEFFALRADSSGIPSWAKYFGNNGGIRFIKELPGGDLLAGINMDTAGAVVARLDANGNFLWCKSYIRPKGMVHDCLIESDSSFIITGYTDSIRGGVFFPPPLPFHPKLFMMKLNGAGDVQWCRGYDSEYNWVVIRGSHIARALDGNYVVLANIRTQLTARPFLMKTDQNGDTLWTRSAGHGNAVYETYNFLACADGGFLYDGETYSGPAGTYLFKTDSLGHLPCWEKPPPPISISDLFPTDSSFTLTSVDGAVALPAFVHDTIYDPVETYDGCTFSTGMNPMFSRGFRIHPNPNTGRFTMEFKDPLSAESYYSVYDTMGRLLYQRPLPSGKTTEEIDLSRFGKGTYVVKVTDKEGVCYERVVVE